MDQSIPKISIVVPCYNAEDTIEACLGSLLAQTMTDIEIVCVDDGSTDRTLELLRQIAEGSDGRVHVVPQPARGTWETRLHGVREATGELIGFLDADDTAEPTFAQTLSEAAQATGADIVVCGYRRVDQATGKVLSQELCQDEAPFTIADDPGSLLGVNTAVWNKAYRARVLRGMPYLAHAPHALEDVCINLLAYLTSEGPVVHAPHPLVNYMVHEGSTVTSITPEQLRQDRAALLDVRGTYLASGASLRLLSALDAAAFEHLGVSMAFRISGNPSASLAAYLEETTAYLDRNFPTWRDTPYLGMRYAHTHNAAIRRLAAAHALYRAHLMGPALDLYRRAIALTGRELKW